MKNITSFILYFFLPGLLIFAIYWIGWGSFEEVKSDLVLKNESAGDLGRLSVLSPPVVREFALLNTGKRDVTISKVYSDCGCLSVSIPNNKGMLGPFGLPVEENTRPLGVVVMKGGQVGFNYAFNPKGEKEGKKRVTAYIETTSKMITKVPITVEIVR